MAKQNVYVVTGGAGGIGLASAKMFKDGIVVISDVAPDALEAGKAVLEKEGIEVVTMQCDVSKEDQVEKMAKEAVALGNVKAVVHSAGVSGDCGKAGLVVKVDLLGTYYMIEKFFNVMESGASMVLISSMMADVVPPDPAVDALLLSPDEEGALAKLEQICNDDPSTAYNIMKRGVRLLVQKNTTAFGQKGIRINSVSPGAIMTTMGCTAEKAHPEQMAFMKSVTPLGRFGQPEEIAEAVAFLCSEKASFITGTDLKVDGGAINAIIEFQMKAAQQNS